MNDFLTIEYTMTYGISLTPARKLTEEEKQRYRPEYRATTFIATGDSIQLTKITPKDLPKRKADGNFPSCSNQAWIISQAKWNTYLEYQEKRLTEEKERNRQNEITTLENTKKKAESQKELPTRAEAKRKMKLWNDTYNEGGEGYVPHIYSIEEYENICARLNELKEGKR